MACAPVPLHLHAAIIAAVKLPVKPLCQTHALVSCFPLLSARLCAADLAQPVFEHVIQTGRYDSCRLGHLGGNSFSFLCLKSHP